MSVSRPTEKLINLFQTANANRSILLYDDVVYDLDILSVSTIKLNKQEADTSDYIIYTINVLYYHTFNINEFFQCFQCNVPGID